MEELFIFPYGGNAIELLETARKKYRLSGFIDDDRKLVGSIKNGYRIYPREILKRKRDSKLIAQPVTVSNFRQFERIIKSFSLPKSRFTSLIDEKASISNQASIGGNVIILQGTVITSNAKIGNHVWIGPNCVIHHDVTIEDYCTIASGVIVAGGVTVKKNCYIGIGATIIPKVTIGQKSLIGAATNVIRSLPDNSKAIGNPAKFL